MLVLTLDQQAALEASGIIVRDLLLFDFPSNYYGFWTGNGIRTWNSIDFVGVESLIEITQDEENIALEASPVTARLRAIPNIGLTPEILVTIEEEPYKHRPVTIYRALLNRTTWAFIDDPFVIWRGIVDQFSHEESADGDYVLVGHFESRAIDYTRRGASVRSSAQQNLIQSGDRFFDYTGHAGTAVIFFGTKVPKKLGSKRSQANLI